MLTTAITQRVAERELKNSRPQGDCIVSTVTLSRDGYRESKFQGRYVGMAHRIVYLAAGFEIPDDYTLDHLCRNRACLNIKHLEPVTLAENLIRARAHRAAELDARGTCVNGHPWTDATRYVHEGTSYCRKCNSEAVARHKAKGAAS